MLVINANNNQDTTNYMLADPQYPDVNQILMRWWPWYNEIYTISSDETLSSYNVPVIDTIGTTAINYYCPKIYKQWLLQWNRKTTDRLTASWYILPDLWYMLQKSNAWYKLLVNDGVFKYTIAVKWLKSWQIVWENIIAPLWRVSWPHNSINYTSKWTFHIEFALLHSDWTITTIASGDMIKLSSWDSNILTDYWSNQVSAFWLHIFNYSWTWQTAQDGDALIATVSLNKASWDSSVVINATQSATQTFQWIIYWNAFNMNIRDPNWFRPFQVSIRDS